MNRTLAFAFNQVLFQKINSSGMAMMVLPKSRATSFPATKRTLSLNRSIKRNSIWINRNRVSLFHIISLEQRQTICISLHNVVGAGVFEGYETHAPSESQRQYNPDYVYESDQTLQPYPNALDSLTVSCNGENKICVAKNLCVDGYVHPFKQGFIRSGQVADNSIPTLIVTIASCVYTLSSLDMKDISLIYGVSKIFIILSIFGLSLRNNKYLFNR